MTMGDDIDCPDCRKRLAALWALVADDEMPVDELPTEWEQRCTRHAAATSDSELLARTAQAICDAEHRGDPDISPFPRTVKERHRRMALAAIAVVGGEVEKLRGVIIDGAVDAYKRENNLT